MKRIISIITLAVLVSAVSFGQEKSDLHKPLYLSFEIGTNANFNTFNNGFKQALSFDELDALSDLELNQLKKDAFKRTGIDLNAKFAAGYRIIPQFTIAAGFGLNMALNLHSNVETLSLPVFIRLRSDFLDRKISPFVELDLGYAFMFKSTIAGPTGLYNRKDYSHSTEYAWFDKDTKINFVDIWDEMENQGKDTGYFEFPSGNTIYTNVVNYDVIRNGMFGELTLGVGFGLKNGSRINIGVSGGLVQCFRGYIMPDAEGFVYALGKMEYLRRVEIRPDEDGNPSFTMKRNICFTYSDEINTESFMDRFHPSASFKIGISF